MPSESARTASAAEARFRIQSPNSLARSIKVIALDARSEILVRRLAAGSWRNATFLTASATLDGLLNDLGGRRRDVSAEIDGADLVVMIATPGGHAENAALIGRACSDQRVTTTALIVGAASASDDDVSATLAQVRPWALMLVTAGPDDYIDDMLTALRA